jgi:hypothetical protein
MGSRFHPILFSSVADERQLPDYFAHEWYHAGWERDNAWNVWFVCEVIHSADAEDIYWWRFLRCELWWGPWH